MRGFSMKFLKSLRAGSAVRLKAAVALSVIALALAGCVVYPNNGYYSGGGYGYGQSYYAPPPVSFSFGYSGGYGGGYHHWHGDDD